MQIKNQMSITPIPVLIKSISLSPNINIKSKIGQGSLRGRMH